ncbi:hypothetical protein WNY97_07810 [Pseudoalteromonas fuliginea]|uniref:hypothetical protein n=1 Tax=Pseudoalteromonas fuliginea TaxID=1872678 RepID=UPI003178C4FB
MQISKANKLSRPLRGLGENTVAASHFKSEGLSIRVKDVLMRFIVGIVFLLALSGCMNPAATGPKFSGLMHTNQDQALVYFYRPLADDGGTVCLNVVVSKIEKGCLGTKGFLGFYLAPGTHTVKIKPDAFPVHTLLEFEVTIASNDRRLFRYSIANSSNVPKDNLVSRYTMGGTVFVQEVSFSLVQQQLSDLNESVGF